jgi:transcriptional regulator with XRE-family HTH domain
VANVSDRLKEERTLKGWSQRDLAQESGTNVDTISGIERGQHEPRPSTLRKLAAALGIQVRDLFEEPALPLTEAPKAGPPRVSKERLEEHFENVRQDEVAYLNDKVIADFWRLALPGEKPRAHFVPDDIDTDRVWQFLEHALSAHNVFEPDEAERINRGARKSALAGTGG